MTRLINADALKQALKSNCKPELCHDYNTAWCERCCRTNDFEDLIDDAPTVERPHGEWIYKSHRHLDDETDDGPVYRVDTKCFCGVCGADFGYKRVNSDNFCKYCGADMREGET